MRLFKIKICGITNTSDAIAAVMAGADAIGLNFYERSLRSVKPETALEIVSAIPSEIAVVGVFVNHNLQDIRDMYEHLQLAAVQLHGDEQPNVMQALEIPNVIRAVRIGDESKQATEKTKREIDSWCQHGVAGILVDKAVGSSYGGSGRSFDWELLNLFDIPVRTILAGGLSPENVGSAIAVARPDAVDVASGVENFPGRKDSDLLKAFIRAAKTAFEKT